MTTDHELDHDELHAVFEPMYSTIPALMELESTVEHVPQ